MRTEFAKRLKSAVGVLINQPRDWAGGGGEEAKGGAVAARWAVEVDYLSPALPPVHYWTWTYAMNKMTEVSPPPQHPSFATGASNNAACCRDCLSKDDWQRLVGTTAEWLFLTQGRHMLMVKGLKGGERARPSSFSMSAAAFGLTTDVMILDNCKACRWRELAGF